MSNLFNAFENSKIYKISSPQCDKFYIGSTIQNLSSRFNLHKCLYKSFIQNKKTNYNSSFNVIKFDDAEISLIESVKCNNRKELQKIEGMHIKKNHDKIFNISIAGRTMKEYYNDNKSTIDEYQKNYQKNYYEKYKNRFQLYYQKNKDKFKLYYQLNKDKIRNYYKNKKKSPKISKNKNLKINVLEIDNFKLEINPSL